MAKAKTDLPSIHISDVRAFRSCRRKWNWSSALGRNLEPVVPYIPFFTGRAIHHCLEMYYGPNHIPLDKALDQFLLDEQAEINKIGELWPAEEASFEEQVALMRSMLEHYKLWVEQDDKMYSDRYLEFITLEQEFDTILPTPAGRPSTLARLGGRFDGVVRHTITGEYWIWECKTARSVQELINSLVNDEQCGAYMYAASKMLNVPIKGVLYNVLRKKAPAVPGLLQDGSLSKATKADTTDFFYRAILRQYFPDYTEDTVEMFYGPTLAALREKESTYFLRFPVYRSQYEIKGLMQNIYQTAKEMINPKTAIYPAPSWLGCTMCHFKSPCIAMNAGSDYEVLLREEYQQRVSGHSVRGEGSSSDDR